MTAREVSTLAVVTTLIAWELGNSGAALVAVAGRAEEAATPGESLADATRATMASAVALAAMVNLDVIERFSNRVVNKVSFRSGTRRVLNFHLQPPGPGSLARVMWDRRDGGVRGPAQVQGDEFSYS